MSARSAQVLVAVCLVIGAPALGNAAAVTAAGAGATAARAYGPASGAAAATSTALPAPAPRVEAHATAPSFLQVRASFVSSEAVLLDRNGVPIAEVRANARVRQLDWIGLDDVSPALAAALVAGEDKRFFAHHGVDWTGLASAAWDSAVGVLDGQRPRGGSTLSMQLAGLLDPGLNASGRTRSLGQKWDQARAALTLERSWSKRQILEAYVNLASYRGELKGVDAAARGLFGKSASGVDAREAAVLVALLRGPNAPAATVGQRACAIATAVAAAADEVADAAAVAPPRPMAPTGSSTDDLQTAGSVRRAFVATLCEDVRATARVTLAMPYRLALRWNLAPHLASRLLRTPGERLRSTLDADLQRAAVEILRNHLGALADRGVQDGALVVLDNATGDVLAYVGSSGELSAAAQVDGVTAPRQAGSTLKPFLYALALDARLLTAASLVDDSAVAIATERGMYVPQNYDRSFHGLVSVRTALASSLNVPAVRTLGLVGVERFHDQLRNLGFETLTQPDAYYGAALALGGADVELLALANAYRALANGGEWSPVRFKPEATAAARRRVLGAEASHVIADILADRGARALSFGLDNALATPVWSAAKTGTSKDMRDNWCVGFTSRYTIGVWVGNFSGAPMREVSGVTGAAPVWHDLVTRLHRALPSEPPRTPAGVERQRVRFEPMVEAERAELFLAGTAMAVVRGEDGAGSASRATPRIRYPAEDAVIALDPDIPPARQRLQLLATPAAAALRWRLDERLLDEAGPRVYWTPTAGRHTLVLENEAGRALSSVGFEVR